MAEREPIGVIGTGYVGLVTAAGFAELGSEVFCVDIDAEKIAALEAGRIPIWEPGLEELVARSRARMHFSTELADALENARLLFVAVGTPPTYSGDADLSAVHAVVDAMPPSDRHALVMKSTVPCGTGDAIKRAFRERGKDGFRYVSCPEFLKEGSAVDDFLHPDRVVVGDEGDWAGDAVVELYAPLNAPLVRTDIRSAEMVKLASNAFLATKISFINEIANVCEETGADVVEVARGMGLDERIGPKFLQAGIGFGGSCFAPGESLLARVEGRARLTTFERLWELMGGDAEAAGGEAISGDGLQILSWVPGEAEPEWMHVSVLTRRDYDGEMVEVETKMGRRVSATADHPFVVGDGVDGDVLTLKLASQLDETDWLPLALGGPTGFEPELLPVGGALGDGVVEAERILVRPRRDQVERLLALPPAERGSVASHKRGVAQRSGDIARSGTMRLEEAAAVGLDLAGASFATVGNGAWNPREFAIDEHFWRVVGLFLAEGCVSRDSNGGTAVRDRIVWSFHPEREAHLVEDVASYWQRHGVKVNVTRTPTSRRVAVSSRIVAAWWTYTLGLGRNSYAQRLPDLVWEQSHERKRALLSGLWEGDGSWSLVNGGPSVILEWGTVSDELAEGVARLLADVGLVCSWRRGRTAKSTKETHWLRVSGAEQIGRAMFLVPERDRPGVETALARQSKRIAPTGFRRFGGGTPWLRVVRTRREHHRGPVFSLEVPGSHTVVTSGGLAVHQCFPKDVQALKQLAGNSGYHFQLLNAVIEVNELQKRRVVGKLFKHLGGSLVGKQIALLGLAFKPNTDDMREASSLVLSARLLADGAQVRVFDPVAESEARKLISGVQFATSALDAVDGADAVVLVTEWREFAELDLADVARRMRGALLVDGRNFLDPAAARAAGLTYEGIGRPAAPVPQTADAVPAP
jgi:UDPglucose 6-dehydrogenase